MSRVKKWMSGIFVVSLVLASVPGFAAEKESADYSGMASSSGTTDQGGPMGGSPAGGPPGSEGTSDPSAAPMAAATAPAAPESAPTSPAAPAAPVTPPALKPITITFTGEISAVGASDNPPMVTVQDRYGVKKEISVPTEAKIMSGTASKALADLKTGDKVTVEYTYDVATGKRTAQTITVGEAPAAAK